MNELQKGELKELVQGKVFFNQSLRDFTSFKIGGKAEVLVLPRDEEDLKRIVDYSRSHNLSYLIMGEGTNLLVKDGGIKGIMVKLTLGFQEIKILDQKKEEGILLQVGAGKRLSELLDFSARNNISGLEFLSGIPGSVGGALAMNAGTEKEEMEKVVHSLISLAKNGSVLNKKREELNFSYRSLKLSPGEIIFKATFFLESGDPFEIREKIKKNLKRRKENQPLNLPSAGSIFKNPPGRKAGKLIEEVGLKGFQLGKAKVSELHANFIVNLGGAKARDVLALMGVIQDEVYRKKGIHLEPEVRVVGED